VRVCRGARAQGTTQFNMRPMPSFAQTLLLLYLLAAVSPSSAFRIPQATFQLRCGPSPNGVAKLGRAKLPVMRTASRLRRVKLIEMTDPYADVLPSANSSRKAWLFLPQVFVLLASQQPATSPTKIRTGLFSVPSCAVCIQLCAFVAS
jgi:hypothetical protein